MLIVCKFLSLPGREKKKKNTNSSTVQIMLTKF